uniref:ATP synthase F0 subunit 8 n=1 Tax=Cyanoplax caverna TaxID=1503210 RepID=A0A0E3DEB2_9MOLL|nr:ATP synthase F0 subunit 8 [Cyanoplax caverna]AIA77054.1 ATP synthase F0 subunit 8 [Cyanoplax caverna]
MPQLAPMNWIFLFLLFWMTVFTVSIWLWWMNSKKYSFKSHKTSFKHSKKWPW